MIDALIQNGIQFTLAVQAWAGSLAPVWDAISQLGTTEFYLLVMPLIYWCVNAAFGIRLAVMLLFGAAFNHILKLALHLPRPYWVQSEVRGYWAESSFGAPSGHAQVPLGMWGLAAATSRRRWFTALAFVAVASIGFSRIALGVHFHFDVLMGWLLAGLTLWLFLKYERPAGDWLKKRTAAELVLVALAASLALVALGALAVLVSGNFMFPAAWEQNSLADTGETLSEVFSLGGVITPAGALFGFGAGLAWLRSRGGFDTAGTLRQRALRYLLGGAVVLIIWMGLGSIFPRGQDLLSQGLRFLRYTLVGFWAAGGAPVLFVRLGLAKASKSTWK
ncbi:MAG TPA: phosphatase PAP2 family protein [Anaerolineales bacterium]|jgi:membrane-associated phospholipid phosphatase